MNRMNISAKVYDVNFISNKLFNINMECTVETLHYYLTSCLHFIHYNVKVVILRTFFSFEARIFEYLDVSEQKTSIIDNLHDKFKLTPIL